MRTEDSARSPDQSAASGGVPCLVHGTRVTTEAGEEPVERLTPGVRLVTPSGGLRPVLWIGRRRINVLRHPHYETVLPVRLRRGAIANGLPRHDLFVSPAQPLLVSGVSIPALHIVNGATIVVDRSLPAVEYIHIELGAAGTLVAEGVPIGCRPAGACRPTFAGGPVVTLYPSLGPLPWGAMPTQHSLPAAMAVRRCLLERAHSLGHALTRDAGLHLLADGRKIQPCIAAGSLYRFVLPEGTSDVHIVSRAGVPAEVDAASCDRRRLGVRLERIVLRGPNRVCVLGADDPALSEGFYPADRVGGRSGRWTDGHASLPPVPAGTNRIDLHVLDAQPAWSWAVPPAAPFNRSA
jgi:hypothetical protein